MFVFHVVPAVNIESPKQSAARCVPDLNPSFHAAGKVKFAWQVEVGRQLLSRSTLEFVH